MSAVVRKRLYDPEKGKTVPTEDEEDDRAIRPNSSLSSIAIVVGIGLLFVLLGVKMRDRSDYAMSSSSLDRVVNNVASAIAASPAKEQYQQEAAKPNQEQEAVTAAQVIVMWIDTKVIYTASTFDAIMSVCVCVLTNFVFLHM